MGIGYTWKTQSSFKIIVVFGVITSWLNILLDIEPYNIIGVMLFVAVIYALEMMNTAVEKICDYIKPESDPNIKLIKDLSAGAVFLVCLFAAIFGILIYGEAVLEIIRGSK